MAREKKAKANEPKAKVKVIPRAMSVVAHVKMPVPANKTGLPYQYSNYMVGIDSGACDLEWPADVGDWSQERIFEEYQEAIRQTAQEAAEAVRQAAGITWLGWEKANAETSQVYQDALSGKQN